MVDPSSLIPQQLNSILAHTIASLGVFLSIYIFFRKLRKEGSLGLVTFSPLSGIEIRIDNHFFSSRFLSLTIPFLMLIWFITVGLIAYGNYFGFKGLPFVISKEISIALILWIFESLAILSGALIVIIGMILLIFYGPIEGPLEEGSDLSDFLKEPLVE